MTDNANPSWPLAARTNSLAIVAIIAAFVFAPAGLICGIIARNQIKQTREQGAGMALAAILISIVALVLWLVALVYAVVVFDFFVHAVHADHCLGSAPPNPGGFHWVCDGNNMWINQG
jgi:hypothetical protein